MKKIFFIVLFLIFSCGYEQTIKENTIVEDKPPVSFLWSSVDLDGDGFLENYITPIKNQGDCGDCYIYGATGLLEIQYKIDHKTQINLDLSEQHLHNCLRLRCEHSYFGDKILKHIQLYGVVEEYFVSLNNWSDCIDCKNYFQASNSEVYLTSEVPFFTFDKFNFWEKAQFKTDEGLKQSLIKNLLNGPIAIVIQSWSGFKTNTKNELICEKNISPLAHFTILVGYENNGEYFFIKNSHGDTKLKKIKFDGSNECGFAISFYQIVPGTTKIIHGLGKEYCYNEEDRDNDFYPNSIDNCPWTFNVDQIDTDSDGFGNVCDPCPDSFDKKTGFYCDLNKNVDFFDRFKL